jgi:hypothetical protein
VCTASPPLLLAKLPRHASEEADVHAEVMHGSPDTDDVAVYSLSPKLSPLTVTDPRPLGTWFNKAEDAAGASKLNASVAVPTTPPTLTCTTLITSYKLASASHSAAPTQLTELADVHAEVMHAADTSCAVAVYSTYRKFSPLTVTDAPKLCGMFRFTYEATGASNDSTPYPVPTTPATLIDAVVISPSTLEDSHRTDVPDVHADVLHGADAIAAVVV